MAVEESKQIEIVLGNKNVAESGSMQVNITQNNFDPAKVMEMVEGLGFKDEGLGKTKPETCNLNPETRVKRSRKPKPARIVQDVYKYVWVGRQEGQMRLIQLYQLLIDDRIKMLDRNVRPDDWCALFMGEAKSFTMKWTGKQAHLRYLFKLLKSRLGNGRFWVRISSTPRASPSPIGTVSTTPRVEPAPWRCLLRC